LPSVSDNGGAAAGGELARAMAAWDGRHAVGTTGIARPAAWILDNADLVRADMRVLDVACGAGRHALLFASLGCTVTAVDRDAGRIDALLAVAAREGLRVDARVLDLERGDPGLGEAQYDLVVVMRYLHRPLMPALVAALARRGVLIYETFTTAQAVRGKPSNPAFLLEPGELVRLVAPLEVIRARESDLDGSALSAVAAIKR